MEAIALRAAEALARKLARYERVPWRTLLRIALAQAEETAPARMRPATVTVSIKGVPPEDL